MPFLAKEVINQFVITVSFNLLLAFLNQGEVHAGRWHQLFKRIHSFRLGSDKPP